MSAKYKMMKIAEKTDAHLEQQAEKNLYKDVCSLIENSRQRLATAINAEACIMHRQIGKRIKEDVLYNKRAEYGKQVIQNLAVALTEKYGKGWSDRKLLHCIRAAYTFSENQIVYAVRTQLTWITHVSYPIAQWAESPLINMQRPVKQITHVHYPIAQRAESPIANSTGQRPVKQICIHLE